MGDRGDPYRILVGIPKGKRPLERPRRMWEGNIETSLQEVGWGDMNWIDLAQDMERWWLLVTAVMNIWVCKMRGIS
jgi:hypothetical protein